MSKLNESQMFEAKITFNKDITAYGNRYWIQIEDTEENDNTLIEAFIKDPVGFGKTFDAVIVVKKEVL